MNTTAKSGSFFRTMVIMGGSVAVGSGVAAGCGGMAGLVPGTGGGPGAGGAPGTGGHSTGGQSGGGPSSGGTIGVGGSLVETGGMGGLGGAFPADCPTAQLSCAVNSGYPDCGLDAYLVLPAGCVCDPERPASKDDCDEGHDFVCLAASVDSRGEPFDALLPFNCECIPAAGGTSCQSHCQAHADGENLHQCSEPLDDLEAYLCGCALTVLK